MTSPIAHTFEQAGPVGQLILITLFIVSIGVWGIIAKKIKEGHDRKKHTATFLSLFRRHRDDFEELTSKIQAPCPLSQIFKDGIVHLKEFLKKDEAYLEEEGANEEETAGVLHLTRSKVYLENREVALLEDSLDRSITTQVLQLDQFHVLLAITAGTAPLLGLLGTVWGIMESFRNMGIHGNASINVVAPGISTALVTTVAGLIVAIPALIAYNLLVSQVKVAASQMEVFAAEFLSRIKQKYLKI